LLPAPEAISLFVDPTLTPYQDPETKAALEEKHASGIARAYFLAKQAQRLKKSQSQAILASSFDSNND
jgi:hypothetical protein